MGTHTVTPESLLSIVIKEKMSLTSTSYITCYRNTERGQPALPLEIKAGVRRDGGFLARS